MCVELSDNRSINRSFATDDLIFTSHLADFFRGAGLSIAMRIGISFNHPAPYFDLACLMHRILPEGSFRQRREEFNCRVVFVRIYRLDTAE